jgi:hypothetical protein
MRMRTQTLLGLRSAAGKMVPAGVVQGAGETARKAEQRAHTVRGRHRVQREGAMMSTLRRTLLYHIKHSPRESRRVRL